MSYFCLVRLSRSTTSKSEWPPPRITWSVYGMYIVFYWSSSRHHSSWRLDISQFCTVMLIVVLHCQNPFDNQLTSVSFEQENAAVNEEDWSSQDAQGWLAVKVHHGCTCTEVWPLQHLDRTGLNFLNHHKLGICEDFTVNTLFNDHCCQVWRGAICSDLWKYIFLAEHWKYPVAFEPEKSVLFLPD